MTSFILGTRLNENQESSTETLGYVPVKVMSGKRRRFHGAFTGGFSAGYFNTVGSEEGFQPQTFVSSANNRAARQKETISNLMDDEDWGTTQNLFAVQPQYNCSKQNSRDEENLSYALGKSIMSDANSSLGETILFSWGWRVGKSIGSKKKIFRPDTKELVHVYKKDPSLIPGIVKHDLHGIGYVLDALDITRSENKKQNEKREQFGGRYYTDKEDENSYDVFGDSKKTDYHTSLADSEEEDDDIAFRVPQPKLKRKSRWGPKKSTEMPGFIRGRNTLHPVKKFPGPPVPPDFDETHVFSSDEIILKENVPKHIKEKNLSVHDRSSWHSMSLQDRQELLGEITNKKTRKSRFSQAPEKPVIDDKKKSALSKRLKNQFEEGESLDVTKQKGGLSYASEEKEKTKPVDIIKKAREQFEFDPEKQQRFDAYMDFKMGRIKQRHSSFIMTQTELQKEIEEKEFEKIWKEISKKIDLSEMKISTDTENEGMVKIYGKSTRTVERWEPERLLCRRFNVPYPKFEDEHNIFPIENSSNVQKKAFDIHEILKPPNLPASQDRKPKQKFPKLDKLTENTTLGEKSHRKL